MSEDLINPSNTYKDHDTIRFAKLRRVGDRMHMVLVIRDIPSNVSFRKNISESALLNDDLCKYSEWILEGQFIDIIAGIHNIRFQLDFYFKKKE